MLSDGVAVCLLTQMTWCGIHKGILAGVPLSYALTFPRSTHELNHHSAERRKTG